MVGAPRRADDGHGEIIVPFPVAREQLQPARRIRSTLIASSLRAIRDRGLLDTYTPLLDAAWKTTILESVAGVWLPLEAGLAHYRACDALAFSPLEQLAIGREVGDRLHGTFLGTMIRAARGAGVTPWTALSYTNKLYERLFDGGGCSVTKLGPKDALMVMAQNRMVAVPYFRHGTRGLWQVAIELFCRKAYLLEVGYTETECTMKVSWA